MLYTFVIVITVNKFTYIHCNDNFEELRCFLMFKNERYSLSLGVGCV